jgi:type II secretory pathway component PulF
VQSGLAFTDALARVPSLASPQVAANFRVGEKLGDVRKVFPVCRGMLKDANSQTRNAVNYLLLLGLVGLPVLPLVLATTRNVIVPKFQSVGEPYGVDALPRGMTTVLNMTNWIAATQILLSLLVCLAVAAYIGGPKLRLWIATVFPTLCDRLMYLVPWRRKRLRRDFAAMLAMLLDAGVPEATSVQLAAAATANHVFLRQAAEAARDLQSGGALPAALRRFDSGAEFDWRLANAAHEPNGFSQIVSTGLVLANGLVVALVVLGVFNILISITDKVALW